MTHTEITEVKKRRSVVGRVSRKGESGSLHADFGEAPRLNARSWLRPTGPFLLSYWLTSEAEPTFIIRSLQCQ